MEDTTLSRQRSEEHLDQGDRALSAFTNRDNLCSYISFNETTWWVFERATIARVCVPIEFGVVPLVVREKLATAVVESIEERRGEGRLQGDEGERSSDGRRLSYQVENN
jgi:hypothetical protein